MTLEQLRALLKAKKEEARGLLATDIDKAEKATEEVRKLQKQLDLALELEEEEKRDLKDQKDKKKAKKAEKVNEMRSIVKHVMGAEMTAEERANIKTTDNSAIIPKQFVNQLQEIQKGYGALKNYCDVIPVFRGNGTIPVIDLDQGELKDVAEGANIIDGTLVTTEIPFKCEKVGLIQSLTAELVDDAEIEIENLVKKNFAILATAKENAKIAKIIEDNATVVKGTSYKDVAKAIDSTEPGAKAGLVTIVNNSTYAELKNKVDKQDRPLNLITKIGENETFNGKPIIVVDDDLLKTTAEKTETYYIANMKEAVKFIDRMAVTVAKSAEAGFRDDTVKIRILERFDVVAGSKRSIKKIEF